MMLMILRFNEVFAMLQLSVNAQQANSDGQSHMLLMLLYGQCLITLHDKRHLRKIARINCGSGTL